MSETQDSTNYLIYGTVDLTTPGGTSCGGVIQLNIAGGTDFADADVFTIQEALAAAFPTAWNITAQGTFPASKQGQVVTDYGVDYSTNPPSFT